MDKFYRTKQGCYGLVNNPYWGKYYRSVPDPAGVEVPDCINNFMLANNFAKLDAGILYAIVDFFRRFEKQGIEAQVILLRGEEDPAKWNVVVPKQTVTGGSVSSNATSLCNLFTGEIMTEYPTGWVYAGTMHLHPGALDAYWSSVDDANELNNPGMHCTIGKLKDNSFNICCSICLGGNRYVFSPDVLIDNVFILGENKNNTTLLYDSDYAPKVCQVAYKQVSRNMPLPHNSRYSYWDTSNYMDYVDVKYPPLKKNKNKTEEAILHSVEDYIFSATPEEIDSLFEKLSTYFF